MKFLALACLLVGTLIAAQASAHDIATQPLTRAECDEAALAWDENGNVCSANSKVAEFQTDLKPAADVSSQPLTRLGCDKAGMTWDEKANVCQSASEAVTSSQPLTRDECGKAGMKWSDDANVCVRGKSGGIRADNPEPAADKSGLRQGWNDVEGQCECMLRVRSFQRCGRTTRIQYCNQQATCHRHQH